MEILTPSDYQSNAKKRPRRSIRPCDACRKRKTRCVPKDGGEKCVHCELRGSSCTFQADPPERAAPYPAPERDRTTPQPGQNEAQLHGGELRSPEQTRAPGTSGDAGRHTAGSTSGLSEFIPDALTLSLSQTRFAELYGLGSDMEPILMVPTFFFSSA